MEREEMNALLGVTEEQLDEMAEEYENGTWEGGVNDAVYGRPCHYIATDGTVLTDKLLDEMAEEYENGTWEGGFTDVVYGRPPLYGEKMATLSFRVPAYLKDAVDSTVERSGISRSQFFRNAICREVLRCLAHELYGSDEDQASCEADAGAKAGSAPEARGERGAAIDQRAQERIRAMLDPKEAGKTAA